MEHEIILRRLLVLIAIDHDAFKLNKINTERQRRKQCSWVKDLHSLDDIRKLIFENESIDISPLTDKRIK